MTVINQKSKYKIECDVEQISMSTDNNVMIKLKGLGPYSLKKGSAVYNVFHNIEKIKTTSQECQEDSKEDSAIGDVKLINAKENIKLNVPNEKLMEWIKFAFEREKAIELEFADFVEKNNTELMAVTIKS